MLGWSVTSHGDSQTGDIVIVRPAWWDRIFDRTEVTVNRAGTLIQAWLTFGGVDLRIDYMLALDVPADLETNQGWLEILPSMIECFMQDVGERYSLTAS